MCSEQGYNPAQEITVEYIGDISYVNQMVKLFLNFQVYQTIWLPINIMGDK